MRGYLEALDEKFAAPQSYFVRPWNDRGPCGDRLIDDPFVAALLQATIGPNYHFCHSALNLAPRGIGPIPFHQDHHHWKHENPVNLAERDKYYVQILYYPNGFTLGDRNLKVIPGSHLVAPTAEATPERMLAGAYDAEVGRELKEVRLAVPPGSLIYINARIFHAVEAKPRGLPPTLSHLQHRHLQRGWTTASLYTGYPARMDCTRQSHAQKTLPPRALYRGMLGGLRSRSENPPWVALSCDRNLARHSRASGNPVGGDGTQGTVLRVFRQPLSVFGSAWQHSTQDITIPPSTIFGIQQQVSSSL